MYNIAFYLLNNNDLKELIESIIPKNITYTFLNDNDLIIDQYTVISGKNKINFDYLILELMDINGNFSLEKENGKAITNYFMQTNIENFFAIGKASNCTNSLHTQLETIFNYIINGD